MGKPVDYSKIFVPDRTIVAPNGEPASLGKSLDLTTIVQEVIKMQMATDQIMPMVRKEIQKGWRQLPNTDAKRSPKSWFSDPLTLQYSLGYKDRRFSLTYEMLKRIASQLSIVNAIVNTRAAQVAGFAQPYRLTRSLGFIIKHKDADHATTRAEIEHIKDLEKFIQNCGRAEPNPYSRVPRDDFEDFLRKIIRDSLILDQACFEIVPDRMGIPYEFMAVDASTIRIASDDRYVGVNSSFHERSGFVPSVPSRFANLYEGREYGVDDPRNAEGDLVAFVQVLNGQIENVYSRNELAFGVRNPRTDIYIQGYGYGELEQLITIVTAHLNAEEYNKKFFSSGSAPKGLLNLQGENWTAEMLEAFQRQWQAQVSGVENAWKTPVIQSEGIEWIDLSKSNRDMEFGNWMEYLIKIACFPEGELVLTGDGFKEIQDIVPGDAARTHTGSLKPVKNLQKKHYEGVLKNIRAGGEIIRCTPEHPFYISHSIRDNTARIREFEELEWVKAEDIVPGRDYLAIPKKTYQEEGDCTTVDLTNYLDSYTLSEDGKRLKNESNASKWCRRYVELNEVNAFVLGLYASEGNATDAGLFFTFSSEEAHLVDAVAAFADYMGLHCGKYSAKETTSNARITNSILAKAVGAMFGHKAAEKRVPPELKMSKNSVKRAFFSGVMAGDGSVPEFSTGAVVATVSSVSENFVEDLRTLLFEQDIYSSIYRNISTSGFLTHRVQSRLDINGTQAIKLGQWLSGVKGDRLRSRIDSASQIKSKVYESEAYFLVPVTECWEEEFSGYVYNIEVEDEHSYQVKRFAVHNCGVFLIDPSELNFDMHGGVQQTPLFESSQEWKLKASRDKGLKPLLNFLAKLINKNIIDQIDDHFTLEFVGLDELSEQEKHQMLVEQLSSYMTLNEVRRQLDMPEIEGGDYPMNPTFLEARKMDMEAQQQQQQMDQQMQMQQNPSMQDPNAQGPGLPGGGAPEEEVPPQYTDNFGLAEDV